MFDRFSERARKTMSFARQEAQRFDHDYIGTEHILLGLVQEGTGVGARVLQNLEIDSRKIRMEVEKIVRNGTRPVTHGQLPFTPRAKRVLELSLEEAQRFGHDYIGTEHLLLGLLVEETGIAAQVLLNLGATIGKMRAEVRKVLRADPRADSRPPSGGDPRPVPWDAGSLTIAQEQATLRRHRFVGTEHLLLEVLLRPGPAADLLAAAGATADAVSGAIDRLRAHGDSAAPTGFTPCARSALTITGDEARRRGMSAAIGPPHLLFGLLSVPEGLAVTALTSVGVKLDDLRANVSELLDAG